jgi:chemotaxis protein MotB
MAKKHKHEEHENHERWLVSYADFITLLFAFFVVMYAISSVNEGKYRVLSDSMATAFKSSNRSLQPVQVGEISRSPRSPMPSIISVPKPMPFKPAIMEEKVYQTPNELRALKVDQDEFAMDEAAQQVDQISKEVTAALEKMVNEELVSIKQDRLWVEVELNSNFLFPSGSAVPSIDAELILMSLAKVLIQHPNQVHVEGFTDNKPIQSPIYPSNWELSSARAGAVVRLFAKYGIHPDRLASVGYGEQRPITTNDTEKGRARNRRVVILIVANLENQHAKADTRNLDLLQQQLRALPTNVN